MSQVKLNGMPLKVTIRPLKPEDVEQAKTDAKKNGADDIFFKLGLETFQASGRGLPISVLKDKNATLTVGDQVAKVVATDEQLNSFGEGMSHPAGLGVGAAVAGWCVYLMTRGGGQALAGLIGLLTGLWYVAGAAVNAILAVIGAFHPVKIEK